MLFNAQSTAKVRERLPDTGIVFSAQNIICGCKEFQIQLTHTHRIVKVVSINRIGADDKL